MKIAAVFASYNRRELALECVRRLRSQSRPPEMVVVADNGSTDGSVEALGELGWSAVRIIGTGANLGNAGAIRIAMDEAFGFGADAVWILDDDSWPRRRALESLIAGKWSPRVVRHALQVDPESGGLTWPMWVEVGGGWRLVHEAHEVPELDRCKSKASWTGALIPREVWSEVGPVQGDLFIRGEDEEYPWRIREAGYGFELVRGCILDHPGPREPVHWSFLGKHFFYERGLADWKLYYKVRNMVWLKKRQSWLGGSLLMAACYALAAWRFDGPHRLPLVREAVLDGLRGRLGPWKHQALQGSPTRDGARA